MADAELKKREKELIKAFETPEQKRLRRLAKKEAKEKRRKALMGWDEEYMGYTNADNPFGDANLHQTFLWKKKYEKLGIKDIDPEEIERQNRIKLEENKRELEKVKQRRMEREREREERLKELERDQRDKEAKQFKEWAKQEDSFHLKQAQLRSKLRMKEGRAKPIDILARYIDVFGEKEETSDDEEKKQEELPFELVEPYLCLNGLRISDLEDLQEDIKIYMELDSKHNADYWKDLQIIVDDELNKLKNYQTTQHSQKERSDGVNPAVSEEVHSIFKGKTPAQLEALQKSIEKKIDNRQEGIDISYWETLLSKLKAFMARARLRERHGENLKKRLERLKYEQGVADEEEDQKPFVPVPSTSAENQFDDVKEDSNSNEAVELEEELNPVQTCIQEYESGRYTPTLLSMNQVEAGTIIVDPVEDWKKLQYQRQKILCSSSEEGRKTALMTADEIAFEREARRGMGSDESVMRLEESITQDRSVASWSDKYRPRKPRYFNRVHTGFEWNKYNQTHYDVDNPPPKIVQGYKFNIFYPDLIDKNQAPTYTVTPCSDNKDFAIIRFKAGPPYEDIAFKIVNREWNYSYKSGFRCQFHNNILQLWFHFKRYRYRR